MWRNVLLYGLLLGLFLLSLQLLSYRFLIVQNRFEWYAGIIALLFMALGLWLGFKLIKPKHIIETRELVKEFAPTETFQLNIEQLELSGISKRELEVLQLMAEGLSNKEIAERLFVSLNTVKTHASKIFEKLDVKRRTQAIQKSKELGLIP